MRERSHPLAPPVSNHVGDPGPRVSAGPTRAAATPMTRASTIGAARAALPRAVASLLLVALGSDATNVHAQPTPPDGPAPPLPPPGASTPPPLPPASSARPPGPPPAPPPGTPPGRAAAPSRPAPPPPPPPPPYYYPPGGTPYYPAPPAVAPAATSTEPPTYLPYPDTDAPVPEGYRVDSRPGAGLLGIGIGMLTAGWATSAVVGAIAADHAEGNPGPNNIDPDVWTPMYIPVAGPFVTLATLRPGPAEAGLLLTGGIFQTAGLLAILLGSLRRTYRLVRTGSEPVQSASSRASLLDLSSVEVAPAVGAGLLGLTTTGRF